MKKTWMTLALLLGMFASSVFASDTPPWSDPATMDGTPSHSILCPSTRGVVAWGHYWSAPFTHQVSYVDILGESRTYARIFPAPGFLGNTFYNSFSIEAPGYMLSSKVITTGAHIAWFSCRS